MRLSLFSVSYAGLWGQHRLDVNGFIAKAAALGYDSIMLMGKRPHLSPLDTDAKTIASIQTALDQHKIRCDVIAGYEMCSPIRGGGELQNLDRYASVYIDWMQQHNLR